MSALAPRLAAPAPGWTMSADVVIVGSGIAGLTTALGVRQSGRSVALVTKTYLDAGSTRWAQGGIAAALGAGDSPAQHERDTLRAGAFLCDPRAVAVLVREGPDRVRDLVARGAIFDTATDGGLALTREGGHLRDRIAHAGGDATGLEIERALLAAVAKDPGIEVVEHAFVLDLILEPDGAAAGVTLHVIGEGRRDGVGAAVGADVVLATGGLGQVFAATTNPPVSTGDGVALALRAGATVCDLEFVQFHPTVLWLGRGAAGQQTLISEAVRGEGAVLVDSAGVRFLSGQHELAELAPRDVVAKAVLRRMNETGADHVWLDGRHLGATLWERRFPTILASCRERGIDPVHDLVPVVPASHYASGGVLTDLSGRTTVPRLYACGEVACTGVHGANRLASNSLLEGIVFAARIAADISAPPPLRRQGPRTASTALRDAPFALEPGVRADLTAAMSRDAGVLRSGEGLERLRTLLERLGSSRTGDGSVEAWEATNLHTVATVLARAAWAREETRGCHWRDDFPARDDDRWCGHLRFRLDRGRLISDFSEGATL